MTPMHPVRLHPMVKIWQLSWVAFFMVRFLLWRREGLPCQASKWSKLWQHHRALQRAIYYNQRSNWCEKKLKHYWHPTELAKQIFSVSSGALGRFLRPLLGPEETEQNGKRDESNRRNQSPIRAQTRAIHLIIVCMWRRIFRQKI